MSCIIISFLSLSDFGRRPLGEVIFFCWLAAYPWANLIFPPFVFFPFVNGVRFPFPFYRFVLPVVFSLFPSLSVLGSVEGGGFVEVAGFTLLGVGRVPCGRFGTACGETG